jgi:queuine tRNA-ribosyltransferase
MSGFSFSLLTPPSVRFGPRLGEFILKRIEQDEIQIQTPNFLTTTSRGVIPHLSRDHYGSSGISWVNVPFESL